MRNRHEGDTIVWSFIVPAIADMFFPNIERNIPLGFIGQSFHDELMKFSNPSQTLRIPTAKIPRNVRRSVAPIR
jgi:hypothetical protein